MREDCRGETEGDKLTYIVEKTDVRLLRLCLRGLSLIICINFFFSSLAFVFCATFASVEKVGPVLEKV